MTVAKNIMSRDVKTIEASATIHQAALVMKENDIGFLVVIENANPLGILSETDIIKKVVTDAKDPHNTIVRDVMNPGIISVGPDDDVVDVVATKMYENKIRRLPVIDNNNLIGIVSNTDLIKVLIYNKNALEKFIEHF